MRFNRHSELAGKHAVLSASKSSWVNYDDEKMDRVFLAQNAAQHGTELHDLAQRLIRKKVKLPETPTTMNLYVNDCIGFRMTPEQVLFFTPNAFGTADAISFRDNVLRISDLKTGVLSVGPRQLEVYAAYFCLEYGIDPFSIDAYEFRIYQNDAVHEYAGDPADIRFIMEKVKSHDKRINALREEME
jgi:hypothetical protein